jgi:RimJ/RimL family protein N-acetyltransferase
MELFLSMNNKYRALSKQSFSSGNHAIVPIRMEDRYPIMRWRNEQLYHLRQSKPLTEDEQDKYFNSIVSGLFEQEEPVQILFSYLEGDKCIGYGGLVHINWNDKNAEISFILETSLEKDSFEYHWNTYLKLIENVAFEVLSLHKIFTYAYDLRPKLYNALESAGYKKEACLYQHGFFESHFLDVIIYSKVQNSPYLRAANLGDSIITFNWASDSKIRKYSFNKKEIEWDEHVIWFSQKISDINCAYYIFMDKGKSIGSIRFDINQEGVALISYLIDPIYHGYGYGKSILRLGIDLLKRKRSDVNLAAGYVQKENISSMKIFENLEFQLVSKDLTSYSYEKTL